MPRIRVNPNIIHLVCYHLPNRELVVQLSDHTSLYSHIAGKMGVTHSFHLGPELLLLYMHNFSRQQVLQLALYTDDGAFYATPTSEDIICRRLQEAIEDTVHWLPRWWFQIIYIYYLKTLLPTGVGFQINKRKSLANGFRR